MIYNITFVALMIYTLSYYNWVRKNYVELLIKANGDENLVIVTLTITYLIQLVILFVTIGLFDLLIL